MKKTGNLIASILLFVIAGIATADGKATYDASCAVCHSGGIAGAPKFGDKAVWGPRIATGLGSMLMTVTKGKGAMPPKGTCADCSKADLTAAIQYMVDNSK